MRKFFITYLPASLLLVFLAMILFTCGGGGGGGDGGGDSAVTLTGLTINGPSSVNESSTATYTAKAGWSDGATSSCTASWAVNPETYASISASGVLTTLPVPSDQTVFVAAAYLDGGITKTDTMEVTILEVSGGVSPAATTSAATSISPTGATLNGSVNPNGLATTAWFEWDTNPAFSNFSTTASQQAGSGTTSQAFDQALTGLNPVTTYFYRVAASNSAGETKGAIVSFATTSPTPLPPAVSTSAATSISSNSATLNGSVNPNGQATNARFEWGTSPTLSSYTETAPQSLGSGTTSQAIHQALSGLSPTTTYYYRAVASNSAGEQNGAIVSFATTSPLPSFSVVSTSPANDEAEIPVDGTISVTFNQDVDPATLGNGVTARSFLGDLPGTVSYDSPSKTATFTSGTPFAPLTEYTVTVATTVKSTSGEALSAPYTSRFTTVSSFWVINFLLQKHYLMGASKVDEGTHCYIYLENGQTVSQTDIEKIKDEFDNSIYPSVTTYFGNEPNPGADGLSKLFIVLLDIHEFYDPNSFTAGYFHPMNEDSNVNTYPVFPSNQKEVYFVDISRGDPSSQNFYKSLAHEFQHIVHWEQKTHQLGLEDDTWLNEAMSEIAPFYAGYGPSYDRVYTFEEGNNRSDSLTVWNSDLADYAVAYMWSQYMDDRFPDDVFKSILTSPSTGIASVETYLNANYPGETFSTVFRDWSMAILNGTRWSMPRPEWSYQTINTWPGTYDGITLPGIFTSSNQNTSQVPSLTPWSVDFYWYTPQSANPTFTLTLGPPPTPQASFFDFGNLLIYFDMDPGTPYPYDTEAYLILQNASDNPTSSSTPTNQSIQSAAPTVLSPMEKLMAVSKSSAAKRLRETTGEPIPICIHDYLLGQEKALRDKIKGKRHDQ